MRSGSARVRRPWPRARARGSSGLRGAEDPGDQIERVGLDDLGAHELAGPGGALVQDDGAVDVRRLPRVPPDEKIVRLRVRALAQDLDHAPPALAIEIPRDGLLQREQRIAPL